MSESKSPEIKEIAEKASEVAKNIWLAGLGAYGKAVDEAHTQYKKVTDKVEKVKEATDQSELFDELVEKGKKLESETQQKISTVKEKAHVSLEERIAKVKENVSFNFKSPLPKNNAPELLSEISEKLDQVISALESPAKPAPKRAATRKASTASAKKD